MTDDATAPTMPQTNCHVSEVVTSADTANAAAFDVGADNVFARIATRYDLLCDIFSLLAHRRWKAAMAREIVAAPGDVVLDAASGTGHIALRVLRLQHERGPAKRVIAADICPEMLAVAEGKARRLDQPLEFRVADVHHLHEIADASVDVYAIAFAMKICDRHRVLAEAFRVLKPGGRLLCMEAAHIPVRWLRAVYLRYMDWCLPLIARVATAGDRSAYDYLLRGIHGFPDQRAFTGEIEGYGFRRVSHTDFSLGIVALHRAVKPGAAD